MAILGLGAIYFAYKISIADMKRRIIPDVYLFPLLLIGLVMVSCFDWLISPANAAISGAMAYTISVIIGYAFEKSNRIKKQNNDYPPIGLGDIKLLAVGGIWLGMTGLAIAIIFATVFSAIWGFHKKQKFIPFAPFFFVGAILSFIILIYLI